MGIRHIVVYLEGSFFRKIEEGLGIKLDMMRTARIISFELTQELIRSGFKNCSVVIEIERNFDEIYVVGIGSSDEITKIIIDFWDRWKLNNIFKLKLLENSLREGLDV